ILSSYADFLDPLTSAVVQCYHPLLVLSVYVHPRNLHSFPTRRSSDLPTLVLDGRAYHLLPGACGVVPVSVPHAWLGPSSGSARRSEEHTSELQSLAYLVCRLLLEKKNGGRDRRSYLAEFLILSSNFPC